MLQTLPLSVVNGRGAMPRKLATTSTRAALLGACDAPQPQFWRDCKEPNPWLGRTIKGKAENSKHRHGMDQRPIAVPQWAAPPGTRRVTLCALNVC